MSAFMAPTWNSRQVSEGNLLLHKQVSPTWSLFRVQKVSFEGTGKKYCISKFLGKLKRFPNYWGLFSSLCKGSASPTHPDWLQQWMTVHLNPLRNFWNTLAVPPFDTEPEGLGGQGHCTCILEMTSHINDKLTWFKTHWAEGIIVSVWLETDNIVCY